MRRSNKGGAEKDGRKKGGGDGRENGAGAGGGNSKPARNKADLRDVYGFAFAIDQEGLECRLRCEAKAKKRSPRCAPRASLARSLAAVVSQDLCCKEQ